MDASLGAPAARSRRRMATWLAVCLLSPALLGGCGGKSVPLAPETRSQLAAEPVVHVAHGAPASLSVYGQTKSIVTGLFGLFGGLAMVSAASSDGTKMQTEYAIEDPALLVKERLIAALRTELGLADVRPLVDAAPDDDALAKLVGTGMVVDVRTSEWVLTYFPTVGSRYRFRYAATARIVRLPGRSVLWEGRCLSVPDDPADAPTMDELKANQGEILKLKLREAADACTSQLVTLLRGA